VATCLFRKVVTTALMEPFKAALIEATHPTQFGSGEKAGGSQLIFGVKTLMESNPGFVCIGLDIKNASSYVGLGKGPGMQQAPFQCSEGMQQGAVESMILFTIIGPPREAFRALTNHARELEKAGLTLQLRKTKCYIDEKFRDGVFHNIRGQIEEGVIEDEEAGEHRGLRVYGIPLGTESFVDTYLKGERWNRQEPLQEEWIKQ